MKVFVVLAVLLLADISLALPALRHRWELTPNSDGQMHLLDLNPFEETVEPSFVPEEDVYFLLWTRSNPTVAQRLIVGNLASVQNSNFNGADPTRVMIHGWQGNGEDEFNRQTAAAYLQRGSYNMIGVDWSVGAGTINYIASRNRVGPVGARTAQLVDFLHINNFIRFEDTHYIGISLGGHAVGHIGKALTRGRAQVINSLDPAGPLFSEGDPANRIAITDAVYVETIITNGGVLGFMGALGHVNFFPNFGRSQPGCGADTGGGCSHARSVFLFIEAINSVFTGHECTSFAEIANGVCTWTGRTARMGGLTPNIGMTGNFFLTTNGESPFTQG